MSELRDIHRRAIELTKLGLVAKEEGDLKKYFELTKEAFYLEKEAALILFSNLDAEPTRSVLFRSAATLAYNCGLMDESEYLIHCALSGTPHIEIKNELKELMNQIEISKIEVSIESSPEDFTYFNLLRENAYNAKIEPKNGRYSKAIQVDSILDFLRNFKTSFLNYVKVSFNHEFEPNHFTDNDKILNSILKESGPLGVNFKWGSFGISIVSDSAIKYIQYSDEINKWKLELFENFKKEVLFPEYSSDAYIKFITSKYSNEERQSIFTNIFDAFKDSSSYKVSATDKTFNTVIKKYLPISKPLKEILAPQIKKEESEEHKKLYRTYGLAPEDSKGVIKKGDIIQSQQIDRAEFLNATNQFKFKDSILDLKNPYEFRLTYEQGDFIISDANFNIYISTKDNDETISKYYKNIIELYSELIFSTKDLTIEEQAIKEQFEDIVFSRNW